MLCKLTALVSSAALRSAECSLSSRLKAIGRRSKSITTSSSGSRAHGKTADFEFLKSEISSRKKVVWREEMCAPFGSRAFVF